MKKPLILASVIAAATGLAVVPASADVAGFYKGKTVRIVVPGGLGASLGLYGRLLAEHMSNHIPGNPTMIVQSQPGGGGTRGASYVYNAAPKDGTVIGEVLAPSVLAPVLRKVRFDATKFQWLGSITPRPSVVSIWHTAGKTVADAQKKEIVMGSTGLGSETYLAPTLLAHLTGAKFKIVKGYKGGAAINKAMEQNEVQGRHNYWTGWTTVKANWLAENKIYHLVQYGPSIPAIPNVPSMMSFAKTADQKAMVQFLQTTSAVGMGFWVAPGVPADRVAALRKAFEDTMADPAFLAAAAKRRAPVSLVKGEDLARIVKAGLNVSPGLVAKMKKVYGFK